MDLERAKEIVAAINSYSLASMGVGSLPDDKVLEKVSLKEMLEATELVTGANERAREAARASGGSCSIMFRPDPRLIAAVYVFLNYSAVDRSPGGWSEGDNVVLCIDDPRRTPPIRFLALGQRMSEDTEDES